MAVVEIHENRPVKKWNGSGWADTTPSSLVATDYFRVYVEDLSYYDPTRRITSIVGMNGSNYQFDCTEEEP